MQPLETAMLLILAGTLAIALVPPTRRPSWLRLMQIVGPVCVALLFQLHAAFEGPRTEMMPAYALGFALLLVAGIRFLTGRGRPNDVPPEPTAPIRIATITASMTGLALIALTIHALAQPN